MTSRTRTLGALSPTTARHSESIWSSCSQSSWAELSTYYGCAYGELRTMTDQVIPGFHARSARGEVFFNPLSVTVLRSVEGSGIGAHARKNTPITCSGNQRYHEQRNAGATVDTDYLGWMGLSQNSFPYPKDSLGQGDVIDAITEACTRVKANRVPATAEFLEDLAEVDRLLGTIPSLCNAGRKVVSKAASRYARIKSSADLYITYRYGISPTIRSIAAVLDEVTQVGDVVRKTTRAIVTLGGNSTETVLRTGNPFSRIIRADFDDQVKIRAMSLDEYRFTMAMKYGYTPRQFISLPWELMPYSFVIDWFTNTGEFIRALSPTPGAENLGGCVVVERERKVSCSAVGDTPASGYSIVSGSSGSFNASHLTRTRGPLVSPGLVIKSDFRLNNLTRAADAISLLIQKMRFPRR